MTEISLSRQDLDRLGALVSRHSIFMSRQSWALRCRDREFPIVTELGHGRRFQCHGHAARGDSALERR